MKYTSPERITRKIFSSPLVPRGVQIHNKRDLCLFVLFTQQMQVGWLRLVGWVEVVRVVEVAEVVEVGGLDWVGVNVVAVVRGVGW